MVEFRGNDDVYEINNLKNISCDAVSARVFHFSDDVPSHPRSGDDVANQELQRYRQVVTER